MRFLVLSGGILLVQRFDFHRGYLNWPFLEKKLSLMSLRVGTLVSEQGVKAAFRLGMDKEVRCNWTLTAVLWLSDLRRVLRFASLGRGDST